MVASCRDLISLNIEGVEYVAMGKANSDPTEHSFVKRRMTCGTNYWTSVQAFMVANRLQQKLHVINLVGFLPQHIQEDFRIAKMKEKEDDTTILTELAEELMNEDRAPYTDTLLVASIGNYAGYVAKEVQTKNSVSSCCKEELCDEGEIEIRIQELMYPPSSRPSLTLWIEALSLIAPAFSRGLACQWPTWCPSEY